MSDDEKRAVENVIEDLEGYSNEECKTILNKVCDSMGLKL